MNSLREFTSYLLGLAGVILACNGYASPQSEYIRVTDYLAEHPDQPKIMARFSDVVRSTPKALTAQQTAPVKVAVVYPGVQSSDYWRRSLKAFERRLQDLKVNYEIKTYLSRPSVDLDLQAEQLIEALHWRPDYLIFTVDALHHRSMIERVILRGKPKLILQNITTPITDWRFKRPFMYTGFDHALGTELLAERMLNKEQLNRFGLLYFSQGYVSVMRGDTFLSAAQQHANNKMVGGFYTDGNRGKARAATTQLLKDEPDMNMLFACSTDIALGALDALRDAGKIGKVTVNGWGGGDAELQALQAKELDLTVMRMNDDASVAMAEAIKLDLEGKASQVPHIYSGDMVLIDQNTSQEMIQKYKSRAFRYSNE
ncbi:substrate-binding domain-containing protein [Neptunomonas marina]|uniref:ABC transporter substrate-binding protein n=1 Tax=Neptunomonas marina TaxID=1815562 RepID=A0A437Q6B6_9GAMM|nr:substrate-binding domain-containing protein [Neptunomonas marina]RVU30052.1 ABC transporter substrate-binding protein [Neptunomonas marina]